MNTEYIVLSRSNDSMIPNDPYKALGHRSMNNVLLPRSEPLSFDVKVAVENMSTSDLVDLKRDPRVIAVAPPMPVSLVRPKASAEVDADRLTGMTATWGVEAVGATRSDYSGEGIKVAVLDTGIDPDHEAFSGVNLIRQNFTNESDDDVDGHGTHVAGTIFGREVDGLRIGVAPGVTDALIGKVLGRSGGSTANIIDAIKWASEEGAHIISMSLGMDFPGYVNGLITRGCPADLATSMALEGYRSNVDLYSSLSALLREQGYLTNFSVIVAAAGNESKKDIHPEYQIAVAPPATSEGVLSVGALANVAGQYAVADFSNTGPILCAPGVDIISARPGGGVISSNGTSMAAPHVAGVMALWAEKLNSTRSLTYQLLDARVRGTATKERLVDGVDPFDVGAGMVQAP